MYAQRMHSLAWVSCFVLPVAYSSIISNPAYSNEAQSEIGEAESAPATPAPSKVDIAKALESRGGVSFMDPHLCDVLEFIETAYDVPILIDIAAVYIPDSLQAVEDLKKLPAEEWQDTQPHYFTDGMLDSLDLRDLTLIEILDEICGALGLIYVAEPGYIWISTVDPTARAAEPEPESRFRAYENEARKQERTSLAFDAIHITEVLESLQRTYGVNLVLDYRAVRPKDWEYLWPRTFAIPQGYATDGHVSIISVKDIEIRDMLKAVLRPLGLSFETRDDAVVISSAARLAQPDSLAAKLISPAAMCKIMPAYNLPPTFVDSDGKLIAHVQHYLALLAIEESSSGEVRARIRSRHEGAFFVPRDTLGATGGMDIRAVHDTTRYSEGDVLSPLRSTRIGWHFEGDAFEDFQLIRIDTAAGCCTIFDEELGREVEICLPQGE